MTDCYVYVHVRDDTGDIFYVGVGRGNRCNDHRKRSVLWRRVTSRTSFTSKIVFSGLSPESAKRKEIRLIKLVGRRNLGKGTLVNLTDGGEGCSGYIATKETRKKLRIAGLKRRASPETREKLKQARLGYTLSEDTKNKIRVSRLQNNWDNGRLKAVVCTVTGVEFSSIREAALSINMNKHSLSRMLRGERRNTTSFTLKA